MWFLPGRALLTGLFNQMELQLPMWIHRDEDDFATARKSVYDILYRLSSNQLKFYSIPKAIQSIWSNDNQTKNVNELSN